MVYHRRTLLFVALGCGLVFLPNATLSAQQNSDANQNAGPSLQSRPGSGQDDEPDPRLRPRSDEERRQAQRAVKEELKGAYKTWLNQDVAYIISDEERKAFKNLSND